MCPSTIYLRYTVYLSAVPICLLVCHYSLYNLKATQFIYQLYLSSVNCIFSYLRLPPTTCLLQATQVLYHLYMLPVYVYLVLSIYTEGCTIYLSTVPFVCCVYRLSYTYREPGRLSTICTWRRRLCQWLLPFNLSVDVPQFYHSAF